MPLLEWPNTVEQFVRWSVINDALWCNRSKAVQLLFFAVAFNFPWISLEPLTAYGVVCSLTTWLRWGFHLSCWHSRPNGMLAHITIGNTTQIPVGVGLRQGCKIAPKCQIYLVDWTAVYTAMWFHTHIFFDIILKLCSWWRTSFQGKWHLPVQSLNGLGHSSPGFPGFSPDFCGAFRWISSTQSTWIDMNRPRRLKSLTGSSTTPSLGAQRQGQLSHSREGFHRSHGAFNGESPSDRVSILKCWLMTSRILG